MFRPTVLGHEHCDMKIKDHVVILVDKTNTPRHVPPTVSPTPMVVFLYYSVKKWSGCVLTCLMLTCLKHEKISKEKILF
jgi:hypothetical protein